MQQQREWFYPSADGSRTVGPLSTEQVAERLRSGELKVDDYIWGTHFEDQSWQQISAVDELRPHLPQPKALPPRLPPPPIPRSGQTGDIKVAQIMQSQPEPQPAPPPVSQPEQTLSPIAPTEPLAPTAPIVESSPIAPVEMPMPTAPIQVAPAPDPAPSPSIAELVAALQPDVTPKSPLAPTSAPLPSGLIETRPASEVATVASEQPSIAAPPADLYVPELETTNPSLRYKQDTGPAPEAPVSGARDLDPEVIEKTGEIRRTEPPVPPLPTVAPAAPAAPVAPEPAPTKAGQTRFTQKSQPSAHTHGHGSDTFHKQTEQIKAAHSEPGEYSSENAYRRYPRVPIGTEVIMRDDTDYYRFRTIDISEKGIRIGVDDTALFTKGEEVTITIRNAPGIGTFSCRGVVMRILRRDEGSGYGIIFMQLNPVIRRSITRYVLDQMAGKMSRIFTKGGPSAA